MSAKHDATLEAIFSDPVRANIPWRDVESLLRHLGAEINEGAGSRVLVVLGGQKSVFHRPHPQKETKRYVVRDLRGYLRSAGFGPEDES